MNPAFSVVIFTAIAGAAQGLVVALAVATLAGVPIGPAFAPAVLIGAVVMLVIGLGSSFLHLGRPERAWRAAMMWRTSWLSREVIVLPAFIGLVALWWLVLRAGAGGPIADLLLPLAAIALAALLWYCTGMIYACLRFIEEWAHPLTSVNFALIGLSSGGLLAAACGRLAGESGFVALVGPAALAATLLSWGFRVAALRRNAGIRHRSTLQSATGIASPHLVQTSMGMSAGSFNTREFFHHASLLALRRVKLAAMLLGFMLPALFAAWGLGTESAAPWLAAVLVQVPGILADRWLFFAQAKHPQNLYYQVVS
jgi:DMSO reductase anchor subunit